MILFSAHLLFDVSLYTFDDTHAPLELFTAFLSDFLVLWAKLSTELLADKLAHPSFQVLKKGLPGGFSYHLILKKEFGRFDNLRTLSLSLQLYLIFIELLALVDGKQSFEVTLFSFNTLCYQLRYVHSLDVVTDTLDNLRYCLFEGLQEFSERTVVYCNFTARWRIWLLSNTVRVFPLSHKNQLLLIIDDTHSLFDLLFNAILLKKG